MIDMLYNMRFDLKSILDQTSADDGEVERTRLHARSSPLADASDEQFEFVRSTQVKSAAGRMSGQSSALSHGRR
jgi:hypothetical protein